MKKYFRVKSFLDIPMTKELAVITALWCFAIALVSYASYESDNSISIERKAYGLSLFIVFTLMLIKMHFNYWRQKNK